MTTNTTTPTADQLNAHLAAGGAVQITTYARATLYTAKHAGWFTTGADGNLYVRHGRGKNCLTVAGGRTALVSIRLGTFTRTA